ncbi:hypothetical protein Patl1_17095 [Pistacia atlantica]|uniref:Uncharacterized protein n=1 Tax=Pistacia atlantica TaxID=434234 RepID=A0ACC1B709_9ROSI|nr:hypothetical protein Patl1_17095 [Pistacia atlantica]
MTLSEIFVSSFILVLLDRLASCELLEVVSQWKIDFEVMKLRFLVSKIDAVIKDVEEKQMEDSAVKLWFDELQDLADDAEDVLDKFATQMLRFKQSVLMSGCNPLKPVVAVAFNQQLADNIKKITERFNKIAKEIVKLGLRENVVEKATGCGECYPRLLC